MRHFRTFSCLFFFLLVSTAYSERGDKDSSEKPSFRVMQFNVLQGWDSCHESETAGYEWERRRESVVKMIRHRRPDIICIQEARKRQCDFLQERCPEYSQILYPKDGHPERGGQRNLIMYRTDMFKCLRKKFFWFSETPNVPSFSWDAKTPKLTLLAQLKPIRKEYGTKKFYVYCAHFFPYGDIGKQQCSNMILESIKKETGKRQPVLFCGDLNLKYLDCRLDTLLTYMQDAAVAAEVSDGPKKVTYNGFRNKNQKALDHIYGRNVVFKSYHVDQDADYGIKWISDHYPVYVDVILK